MCAQFSECENAESSELLCDGQLTGAIVFEWKHITLVTKTSGRKGYNTSFLVGIMSKYISNVKKFVI